MKKYFLLACFALLMAAQSDAQKSSQRSSRSSSGRKGTTSVGSVSHSGGSSHKASSTRSTASSNVSKPSRSTSARPGRTDIKPTATVQSATPAADLQQHETLTKGETTVSNNNGTSPSSPQVIHTSADSKRTFIPYRNKWNRSYCEFRNTRLFYRHWWRNWNTACNWTGDVTFVNKTAMTLDIYVTKMQRDQVITTDSDVMPPLSVLEVYAPMSILAGDSLTFKMPCDAMQYELTEHQERGKEKNPNAFTVRGNFLSTSADKRIEVVESETK